MTWLLYNLQLDDVTRTDFEDLLYTFSQSEKRYWVYNYNNLKLLATISEKALQVIGMYWELIEW